jgi:DNA-directed RNA polymerase specialized sigma24 family protein
VLAADRDRRLRDCLERLPTRCRVLLRLLVAERRPSYEQISSALGVPIGSIGPTRGRCLALLRRELERAETPVEAAAIW